MVQFGASDFSMSIGKTGQYKSPDVLAAELQDHHDRAEEGQASARRAARPWAGRKIPRDGRQALLHGWDVRILADWWDTKGAEMRKLLRAKPRKQHLPSRRQSRKHQDVPPAQTNGRAHLRGNTPDTGELPVAPRRPFRRTLHGVTLTDDYAWLKDPNGKSPAQARTAGAGHPRLSRGRESLHRGVARPDQGVAGDPGARDARAHQGGRFRRAHAGWGYAYLWKYREGGQHELIAVRRATAARFSSCSTATRSPRPWNISILARRAIRPTNRLVAWSADLRGSEYFTIRVRDWQSGEDLPDSIEQDQRRRGVGRRLDVLLLREARPRTIGPLHVFRHRLGTPQSDDVLVYEEMDTGWFTSIEESASGRFCIVASGNQETSEQWLIDLAQPYALPRLVQCARPACATASTTAAMNCSSAPTQATRSTFVSTKRRSPRPTAPTGNH